MSGWTKEISVHCDNDCKPSGCPGHTLALRYQGVTDTVAVTIDGHLCVTFDANHWAALLTLAREPSA